MTRENEGSLPAGKNFANALDELFRSGDFSRVMASTPYQAEIPAQDELLKEKIGAHIENFCLDIHVITTENIDRRNAAASIRDYFESWHQLSIRFLEDHSSPESEITAMRDLTLKGVAQYATEQFNRYKRDAATLTPGTPTQIHAREKSDYWSMMEELITPAADPD